MTSILDRIRATTPETLERDGVTGDFSDVAAAVYRPRKAAREMIRTVEGADDLRHPNAGCGGNDGMSKVQDWSDKPELPTITHTVVDDEPMRPAQRGKIWHLMNELRKINPDAGAAADEWWARQEDVTKVQASEWITRLKGKIAAGPTVCSNCKTSIHPDWCSVCRVVEEAPARSSAWAKWRKLAAKLAVVGGKHGTRFAVDTEEGAVNSLAFWRISPSRDGNMFYLNQVIGGQGPVKVRMSPEAMIAIAEKIIAAGPVEAMVRYGLELGECGHCGRELTNDESRAMGIGPHCRKHMGGWN